MAKTLTALKTNMATLNNSGTTDLSVMMPLTSISLSENFKDLFPLDDEKVQAISNDMKETGFDKSQPIHVWKHDNVNELIDGHTRLAAAKRAGLYDIPVFIHHFNSTKDAQLYALNLQIKRRNLSSSQILYAVEMFDSIKKTGRKPEGSTEEKGRTSEKIAEEIGVSPRTVQKAQTVNKLADDETKAKIKSGEMSINQAYTNLPEVKERKGSKKKLKDDTEDDIKIESLEDEDNSENPQSISFKQRKETEPSHFDIKQKEEEEQRVAANKKLQKEAHEEGFSEGFQAAFTFVLAQVIKGKSPKEIYELPEVQDLSPSVISSFKNTDEDEILVYKLSN